MGIDYCNDTERLSQWQLFGTKRDMDIKPLYTYLCPVIIFVCFFSIIFNAILMSISRQSKVITRCNKSPILLLSLNLAVTDLIASLLNGLGILFNSYLPEVHDIKMGQCTMLMFEVFRYASLVASALHLLALAFVHYRGIVNPLHYRSTIFFSQHLSRTINIISIACWIIPLTIMIVWFSSSPCQGFQSPECDYLFLLGFTFRYMVLTLFALPLLLMSAIYLRIFIIISKHQKGRRINHERSTLTHGVISAVGPIVTAAAVNLPELEEAANNIQTVASAEDSDATTECAACAAKSMRNQLVLATNGASPIGEGEDEDEDEHGDEQVVVGIGEGRISDDDEDEDEDIRRMEETESRSTNVSNGSNNGSSSIEGDNQLEKTGESSSTWRKNCQITDKQLGAKLKKSIPFLEATTKPEVGMPTNNNNNIITVNDSIVSRRRNSIEQQQQQQETIALYSSFVKKEDGQTMKREEENEFINVVPMDNSTRTKSGRNCDKAFLGKNKPEVGGKTKQILSNSSSSFHQNQQSSKLISSEASDFRRNHQDENDEEDSSSLLTKTTLQNGTKPEVRHHTGFIFIFRRMIMRGGGGEGGSTGNNSNEGCLMEDGKSNQNSSKAVNVAGAGAGAGGCLRPTSRDFSTNELAQEEKSSALVKLNNLKPVGEETNFNGSSNSSSSSSSKRRKKQKGKKFDYKLEETFGLSGSIEPDSLPPPLFVASGQNSCKTVSLIDSRLEMDQAELSQKEDLMAKVGFEGDDDDDMSSRKKTFVDKISDSITLEAQPNQAVAIECSPMSGGNNERVKCKVALKTQTSLSSIGGTVIKEKEKENSTFAKEVKLLTLPLNLGNNSSTAAAAAAVLSGGRLLLKESSTFHSNNSSSSSSASTKQLSNCLVGKTVTTSSSSRPKMHRQQSNPIAAHHDNSLTFAWECTCDNKSRQFSSKLSRSNTIGTSNSNSRGRNVVVLGAGETGGHKVGGAKSVDTDDNLTNSFVQGAPTTTTNKTMVKLSNSQRPSISSAITASQGSLKYHLYHHTQSKPNQLQLTNLNTKTATATTNKSSAINNNDHSSSTYEPTRRHIHASAIPQTNTKALVTTLLILGTYLISYVPAIIFQALTCTDKCPYPLYDISFSRRVLLGAMTNLLLIAKSIIDPFIYSYRMNEIKLAITRYLSKRRSKTSFANSMQTSQRFINNHNRSFHNSNYHSHNNHNHHQHHHYHHHQPAINSQHSFNLPQQQEDATIKHKQQIGGLT